MAVFFAAIALAYESIEGREPSSLVVGLMVVSWAGLAFRRLIPFTVLVVAVPEGLPLAVTLSLAYSVKVIFHSISV